MNVTLLMIEELDAIRHVTETTGKPLQQYCNLYGEQPTRSLVQQDLITWGKSPWGPRYRSVELTDAGRRFLQQRAAA
jgi:hypothetical protein